jgi:hypothetical protein
MVEGGWLFWIIQRFRIPKHRLKIKGCFVAFGKVGRFKDRLTQKIERKTKNSSNPKENINFFVFPLNEGGGRRA